MSDTIDISKLDKAEVLAALFNNSRQQGMGLLFPSGKQNMTVKEAYEELKETKRFDYLRGRVLKVNLEGDSFRPGLYDRDNGQGAAQAAIANLKPVS